MTKYTPIYESTFKDHMHAQQSKICSTKKVHINKNMENTISTPSPIHSISKNKESCDIISSNNTVTDTLTPSSSSFFSSYKETPGLSTHHTYADYQSITDKIGTDQTGRFFVPSISRKNYFLIIFDFDRNYIFAELLTNCTKHSIKNAYANILKILKNRGIKPQLHRLENEASDILKEFITEQHVDYQLTLAGLHWRNWYEREIQTFKNNFIAGLCSTYPNFPLNLW